MATDYDFRHHYIRYFSYHNAIDVLESYTGPYSPSGTEVYEAFLINADKVKTHLSEWAKGWKYAALLAMTNLTADLIRESKVPGAYEGSAPLHLLVSLDDLVSTLYTQFCLVIYWFHTVFLGFYIVSN